MIDINSQVVAQDPARELFKDTRRNSLSTVSIPLPVDAWTCGSAREQAGPDGEEVPPAALGIIETELQQLKTQIHQILSEREAERVQEDPFDRPPSYS